MFLSDEQNFSTFEVEHYIESSIYRIVNLQKKIV